MNDTGKALRQAKSDVFIGMILAFGISLFVDIAVMVVPIYDMQLYDRIIQSHNMNTLATLSLVCAVGLILYGVVDFLRSAVLVVIADKVTRRLSGAVLRTAVERRAAGDISVSTDALRDLNELKSFIANGAIVTPLDALCTPLLIGVLFLLHPAYGYFSIAGVAIIMLFGLAAEWLGRPGVVEATIRRNALASSLSSRLREPVLTDGMGMLPAIAQRWSVDQSQILADLRRATGRAGALASTSQVVRIVLQVVLMCIGAMMILAHTTTPGSLMGANMLLAKTLSPFDTLVSSWREWSLARASWSRLQALLTAGGDYIPGETTREDEDGGGVVAGISVRSVNLARAGVSILNDVSFNLPPGSSVGVVGPNGCGKSTLLRLLAGIIPPDEGTVLIDGKPARRFAGNVGYLPQGVGLMDGTVTENVMRFRRDSDRGTANAINACRRAGIHDIIGRLRWGYDSQMGDGNTILSGGQRQRVGLARAIFEAPRVLILDEPDSNVDHLGVAAITRAVADAKSSGAMVVVVTHRPGLLAEMDYVLRLEAGKLVSFGPVKQPDVWTAKDNSSPNVVLSRSETA